MRVRIVWKPGGTFSRAQTAETEPPPEALVDLCSQILWGLDDGPPDLDHSLAMLKVAADHGTTDIVAAPRTSFEYLDPQIIARRVAELQARSNGSVRIYAGCTVHLTFDNIREVLADPQKYSINGQNHLLVELPGLFVPPATESILANFIDAGIVPVICQPERNPLLQRSLQRAQNWIAMGCFLQVAAGSVLGLFGKTERDCAWDLIGKGMVHVIASNARDARQNSPRLDAAWRLIKHKWGEDVARRLLVENPMTIIQGRAVRRKPIAPMIPGRNADSAS
jgi:protein-tyrosine phosphatase